MTEQELAAVKRASGRELARAMAKAARMIGDREEATAVTMFDAAFALGLLSAAPSALTRACLRTALGR
jgi:hypothetical protein